MTSLQKRHHWDKRKRRYIQLQPKEEVKAGKRLKTESGARAIGQDAPSGLYQKWVKTNKRRVAHAGEEENGAAAAYSKNLANRWEGLVSKSPEHQILTSRPLSRCYVAEKQSITFLFGSFSNQRGSYSFVQHLCAQYTGVQIHHACRPQFCHSVMMTVYQA